MGALSLMRGLALGDTSHRLFHEPTTAVGEHSMSVTYVICAGLWAAQLSKMHEVREASPPPHGDSLRRPEFPRLTAPERQRVCEEWMR